MADAPKRIKASEAFRGRVLARFRTAIDDLQKLEDGIDATENPHGYIPKSSNDTALTAFAQLAALRLDASRALISLISPDTQYILAESTRTLSLQSDARHGTRDSLWLGAVAIPRTKGVCGLALENAIQSSSDPTTSQGDITIIEDMREHPRTKSAAFVTSGVCLRFYAGVPIHSPDGAVIGVLSVFDDKPRSGLDDDQKTMLKDIAATIMDHLEAARIRAVHARTDKLVTGLESFIDGLENTRTAKAMPQSPINLLPETTQQLAMQDVASELQETAFADSQAEAESKSLWNQAMSPGSKPMFSRAATIIRQSGDYDGCAIFYMPSTRKANHPSGNDNCPSHSPTRSMADNHTDSGVNGCSDETGADFITDSVERHGGASDTDDSIGTNQRLSKTVCPLLSYSLASDSDSPFRTPNPFPQFKLRDMEKLSGKHPRPRTFTFDPTGELIPSDSSGSGSGSGSGMNEPPSRDTPVHTASKDKGPQPTQRQLRILHNQGKLLRKLSSVAQSFACLPLWDSERQRWLAYCICWTSSASRHLKEDGDLGYLRVFGNSISMVLSHIDAIASHKTKTTFVSSISHELRSPLHGILSATNFLRDSKMSRFDREMIDVVSNCGRTLLDTVDHVMDFAKISSMGPKQRRQSVDTSAANNQKVLSQDAGSSLSTVFDLSTLVEEVVEAVLMGYSVQHDFLYSDEDSQETRPFLPRFSSSAASLGKTQRVLNSRGKIRLVLEVRHRQDWTVYSQAGAWRRILMNLFGNALKYTDKGLITIRMKLHAEESGGVLPLSLEVVDTGKGMSSYFMDTRLYMPFSQEDPHSSGTGLGLNIVKQIVEAQGGSMNVFSTQSVGTNVRVNVPIPTAICKTPFLQPEDDLENLAVHLTGLKVFLLGDIPDEQEDELQSSAVRAEIEFRNSLALTLKQWFELDVSHGTRWPSTNVDLIICLKPMLKYLEDASKYGISSQPVIIVAYDALEMAALRADARVTRNDAVVEIASQPLGPHKLAGVLKQCLERQTTLLTTRPPLRSANAFTTSDYLPILSRPPSISSFAHLPATPPRDSTSLSSDLYRDPFILIVDDNKVNLRLLSVFIKKQGFKYHEATNGQEAVDIFQVAKRSVLCILMDISMPVLDGMAATRLIRDIEKQDDILPHTSIIALTGLTSAASRNEAHEAGMDEFLTKPITFSQLSVILKRVTGI